MKWKTEKYGFSPAEDARGIPAGERSGVRLMGLGRECRQAHRIRQEVLGGRPMGQIQECCQGRRIRREALEVREDRPLDQVPGCGLVAQRPTAQVLECSLWKSRFL